jgi:hypothetical protein
VAGRFESASHGLADPIGGHEQPLLIKKAPAEEIDLLRVKLAPPRPGVRKHRQKGGVPAISLCVNRSSIEQLLHPRQV